MLFVSEIYTTAPSECQTPLQSQAYKALAALEIPYERVDTDEVITMGDCASVNAALDVKMVKTLLLCNRQQTQFYLFVTAGDKPFHTKVCSSALGTSRLSFAPADRLEQILGTKIGAATIFSTLLETAKSVQVVLDRDVVAEPWYGCSDGTTTGYLKIATNQIVHVLLPHAGLTPTIIAV